MAVRQEDLDAGPEAVVYAFPVARVRRAAAHERMMRRRRRTVAAAFVLVAGLGLLTGPRAAAPASRPGAPSTVTVGRGDTLWEISSRYAPEGMDVRAYLAAVIRLNELDGLLQEGARIRLPR